MNAIANDTSLPKADKFYVYKQICDQERKGRDSNGRLITGTSEYRVEFELTKPTGLPESLKGDVVRNIIIDPTNDNYHGSLVYGSAPMAALWQSGINGVIMHETIKARLHGKFDKGDMKASTRQLECLNPMQLGGFNAYASKWNEKFAK